MEKINILVICSGNICRSPLAEIMFRREIENRGLFGLFEVKSCGTLGISGKPASKNSAICAADYDLNLAGFFSTGCSRQLLDWADRIYCLSQDHVNFLAANKVTGNIELLSPHGEIPDPYGMDLETYKNCARVIDGAVIQRMDELCK